MKVDDLMPAEGASIYYDPAFRNVLEDHMTFLREHPQTSVLNVEPTQAYRFEHDLFGLLAHYGVSRAFHWVVMRMNKMTTPTELTRDAVQLLVPETRLVEQIRQSHMTKRRIT